MSTFNLMLKLWPNLRLGDTVHFLRMHVFHLLSLTGGVCICSCVLPVLVLFHKSDGWTYTNFTARGWWKTPMSQCRDSRWQRVLMMLLRSLNHSVCDVLMGCFFYEKFSCNQNVFILRIDAFNWSRKRLEYVSGWRCIILLSWIRFRLGMLNLLFS